MTEEPTIEYANNKELRSTLEIVAERANGSKKEVNPKDPNMQAVIERITRNVSAKSLASSMSSSSLFSASSSPTNNEKTWRTVKSITSPDNSDASESDMSSDEASENSLSIKVQSKIMTRVC